MMMEENTFLNISLNLANIPSAYFCECCGRIIFPQTTQIIIPIFARLKDYFFYAHGHRGALLAGVWHQDAGTDGSKINKNMLFSAFFIHFFAIFAV